MKLYEIYDEAEKSEKISHSRSDEIAKAVVSALPHNTDGSIDYEKTGDLIGSSLVGCLDRTNANPVTRDQAIGFVMDVFKNISSQSSPSPMMSVAKGVVSNIVATPKVMSLITGILGNQ